MADKEKEKTEDVEESKKLDETVPGGSYVVDGRTVNADGQELDSKGQVKKQ
jgi:hypothetical protein